MKSNLLRLLKGFALEIRVPPVTLTTLTVLIGQLLAWRFTGRIDWTLAMLLAINGFIGNWSGHYVDTYVDYYVRKEYELGYKSRFGDAGGILSARELINFAMLMYGVSLALTGYIWYLMDFDLIFIAWVVFLYLLSASYPIFLDKVFVIGDITFGVGVASILLLSFYVGARFIPIEIAVLAGILWLLIFGSKVVDSLPDVKSDVAIGKWTIPAKLGFKAGKAIAYAFVFSAYVMILILLLLGVAAPTVIFAVFAGLPGVIVSLRQNPHNAENTAAGALVSTALCLFISLLLF